MRRWRSVFFRPLSLAGSCRWATQPGREFDGCWFAPAHAKKRVRWRAKRNTLSWQPSPDSTVPSPIGPRSERRCCGEVICPIYCSSVNVSVAQRRAVLLVVRSHMQGQKRLNISPAARTFEPLRCLASSLHNARYAATNAHPSFVTSLG